jgi:hypothetical protein
MVRCAQVRATGVLPPERPRLPDPRQDGLSLVQVCSSARAKRSLAIGVSGTGDVDLFCTLQLLSSPSCALSTPAAHASPAGSIGGPRAHFLLGDSRVPKSSPNRVHPLTRAVFSDPFVDRVRPVHGIGVALCRSEFRTAMPGMRRNGTRVTDARQSLSYSSGAEGRHSDALHDPHPNRVAPGNKVPARFSRAPILLIPTSAAMPRLAHSVVRCMRRPVIRIEAQT